jgi:hypothetical protein
VNFPAATELGSSWLNENVIGNVGWLSEAPHGSLHFATDGFTIPDNTWSGIENMDASADDLGGGMTVYATTSTVGLIVPISAWYDFCGQALWTLSGAYPVGAGLWLWGPNTYDPRLAHEVSSASGGVTPNVAGLRVYLDAGASIGLAAYQNSGASASPSNSSPSNSSTFFSLKWVSF